MISDVKKYLDVVNEAEQKMLNWRSMIPTGSKWTPTIKQDLIYKPHVSTVNSQTVNTMRPFTYATVSEPFDLKTVTSRGEETVQPVDKGDIIISGPTREKYHNKAAKFTKNYPIDKGNGARGPDTRDIRQVLQYKGPAGVFAVSYGGTSDVYPGDWLVLDTSPPNDPDRAPFYKVSQHEFERTYKIPSK